VRGVSKRLIFPQWLSRLILPARSAWCFKTADFPQWLSRLILPARSAWYSKTADFPLFFASFCDYLKKYSIFLCGFKKKQYLCSRKEICGVP